jgi:hypothetical protein
MTCTLHHGSGPLSCEDKQGRPSTSSDAAVVLPTLAFAVVACRLLPPGCRACAACSPPAGLGCPLRWPYESSCYLPLARTIVPSCAS